MYGSTIIETLQSVGNSFEKNELAYLALTSKVENPLRDRLAYRLHSIERRNPPVIAREWHRRDLAILKNGSPKAIVEMKAMYTFDAAKDAGISGFSEKLVADFGKARSHGQNGLDVFGLLLATHPHGQIDKKYDKTVKYLKGINAWSAQFENHEALLRQAKRNVKQAFPKHPLVASGELIGGHAFGVSVSVHYWMFRA